MVVKPNTPALQVVSTHCEADLSTDVLSMIEAKNEQGEWLRANRKAIEAINEWVESNGSFTHFQRAF